MPIEGHDEKGVGVCLLWHGENIIFSSIQDCNPGVLKRCAAFLLSFQELHR